jgi:hypothetical protein
MDNYGSFLRLNLRLNDKSLLDALCMSMIAMHRREARSVLTTLTAIHKYGVRYQNSALRMSVEAALTVKANITATAPSIASRGFGSTVITIF